MVDASNGFNELSCMAMLWTMHHLWPKASWFAFNCYRHKAMPIICNPSHTWIILWSCKGITQGDPLAIVLYGIVLVPLVKILQHTFPDIMQPWYADNSALMGRHGANAKYIYVEKDRSVVWILSGTQKIVAGLLGGG